MRPCLLLALVGCGEVSGNQVDAAGDGKRDGAADTTPARCDVTKPFGAPVNVGGVNTNSTDIWGWLSPDQLTIYFGTVATGGVDYNIYSGTRAQPMGAFSGVLPLGGVNTQMYTEDRPVVTADGLTLIAETNASGQGDLYVATRMSTAADFSALSVLAVVNSPSANDANPWISDDGLLLYFGSARNGTYDIFRATRASVTSTFSMPMAVGELNTAAVEDAPVLSRDGLEIFFASTRVASGASPRNDIFNATRSSTSDGFGTATLVAELSTDPTEDFPNWLSPDRCELMFSSDRSGGNGGYDIWLATRPL